MFALSATTLLALLSSLGSAAPSAAAARNLKSWGLDPTQPLRLYTNMFQNNQAPGQLNLEKVAGKAVLRVYPLSPNATVPPPTIFTASYDDEIHEFTLEAKLNGKTYSNTVGISGNALTFDQSNSRGYLAFVGEYQPNAVNDPALIDNRFLMISQGEMLQSEPKSSMCTAIDGKGYIFGYGPGPYPGVSKMPCYQDNSLKAFPPSVQLEGPSPIDGSGY